jgi:hypothetical protein
VPPDVGFGRFSLIKGSKQYSSVYVSFKNTTNQ